MDLRLFLGFGAGLEATRRGAIFEVLVETVDVDQVGVAYPDGLESAATDEVAYVVRFVPGNLGSFFGSDPTTIDRHGADCSGGGRGGQLHWGALFCGNG